ncbi:MAG: hypothetical protein P8Y13_04970 [Deinococcales bacterium]
MAVLVAAERVLRVVEVDRRQPGQIDGPVERRQRGLVPVLVAEVVAGDEGVAGVEADTQVPGVVHAPQDLPELVEVRAQRAALPCRVLEQDARFEVGSGGEDLIQRARHTLDAGLHPFAHVGARVEHEAGHAQAVAAFELISQRREGLLAHLGVGAREVDQVARVRDHR